MDLLNLFDWMKCKEKFEEKDRVCSFVMKSGDEEGKDSSKENEYECYYIVLTQYFNEVSQQLMKVYCNEIEAYNLFLYMNQKIVELGKRDSVSLCFACRNENGDIVQNGISGVVGISHNIPAMIKGDSMKDIEDKEKELSLKN